MASSTILHQHPNLGKLKGQRLSEHLVQFRNIIYATVPLRWARSEPVNNLTKFYDGRDFYDGTAWGPIPPQPDNSIDFDFGLIQKPLPYTHQLNCDEEKCLNLCVTVPSAGLMKDKKLPVVVLGGFFIGCNSWPQYDMAALAARGEKTERPIITVGINYRLGLLGFLATSELSTKGPGGNFGLYDQSNALEWIQQHIAGFGGDRENVTVFGESAGAISVWQHLLRGKPLFRRAMCMSGDPRLRPCLPAEAHEGVYQNLLEELGIKDLPVKERIQSLRNTPWRTLTSLKSNLRCFPTLDGQFKPLADDPAQLRQQVEDCLSWCKTIVLGDCRFDASAMVMSLQQPKWLDSFISAFAQFFDRKDIDMLVSAYGLADNQPSSDAFHQGLVQLVSDVRFYMPIVLVEEAISSDANVRTYHFHEPNPFDGIFKGHATHVLDVAYALQTYENLLPKESRAVSHRMGDYLLDLAYGKLDSPSDKESRRTTVLFDTDHQERTISTTEYDAKHRHGAAGILRSLDIDRLNKALNLFQFGMK
ncbi:Alpha/Beta hydrolase protein [Aspergillus pseudodeflectus]|uniref:Carboxylic ester hydrolase n=1 Tax=Aspergillus pseudodeflectus TaxID=176178 RepID=A0ABR4JCP0_9EURO